MTKHKELVEGVGGSGQTSYIVATVCDATGKWLHTEKFNRKSEALLDGVGVAMTIATHCYGFTIRFALRNKVRERAEHWHCLRSSAHPTLQGEFDPPKSLDDARAELQARVLSIITDEQYVAISRLYTRPGKTHYVGLD